MCGVRTKVRQYSSCVLLDVGDGIDSIFATNHAMGRYIAQRAGIGLNFGRLRAIGSSIRGGEVVHTGVIPFLKVFEATTKSCSQSGVRGGSSTTHFPFWHQEIQDVITLKSNKRSAETAVRKLDYSVQFCRLFYKRLVEDGDITLFSPNDVPGLYEAFGYNDKFESLYTKYEKDKSIKKTTVPARDFMNAFCQERGNTGRIYLQNIDHVNENSPFLDKISMSNLCLTGDTLVDVMIEGDMLKLSLGALHGLAVAIHDDEDHKEIKVLSYNIDTGVTEYKKLLGTMLTAKDNDDLYTITDDATGKTITCTGDHKVYTSNRGYVEARLLEETDSLVVE
jgi:ribonucleoside-diphosphate reductase alpha chain